jgi:serine-type D-Ala-D-Ala carboxypeptidase
MSPSIPSAAQRSAELDAIAMRAVEHHRAAPAAVVACALLRQGTWRLAEGAFGSLFGGGPAANPDTIFDLASVTKPFTAVTLARVARRGLVNLDTELGSLVPEAVGSASEHVRLELLLAHRAGLEAHRRLYAPLEQGASKIDREAALRECACARIPDCTGEPGPEGFPPLYSDLGYLLLGEAVRRASSTPLDFLVRQEVSDVLGLRVGSARQWMARGPDVLQHVAPTEIVGWRGGMVRGLVHDENALAMSGRGMSGHAGLFGTARDVVRFGAALLEALASRAEPWLGAADLQPLLRPRPGGTLRAGFDSKSESGSSAGPTCSMSAFGHLGFTGTSVWIDPERSVVVCMLSNRVHPCRDNDAIKAARPDVHERLMQWALRN